MKRFLLLLALWMPLAAANPALKPGEKYDFIATDGQNVYGAVFVRETASAYFVLTEGLGSEPIAIEKNILAGPPQPSGKNPEKQTVAGRSAQKWNLSVAGDLRMASGSFADYAQFFPGASLRFSRKVESIPFTGINAFSLLLQYAPIARSPRRIDLLNFALGPKWRKRFRKIPDAEFHLLLAPTVSVIRYNSYTYSAWSTNFGAVAAAGLDWSLGSHLAITAILGTQYIQDSTTFVMVHSFSLGVGYSW
jgi:hypothetical protein